MKIDHPSTKEYIMAESTPVPTEPTEPTEPSEAQESRIRTFIAAHPRAAKIAGITAASVVVVAVVSAVQSRRSDSDATVLELEPADNVATPTETTTVQEA